MNDQPCCPIVELRQYTLVSGGREALISLFEEHFIESQEATGIVLIGQFRDLDHPDRFVWLRGFTDMAARARQLEQFYGGPIWKEHRDAANATMIDSDNVLLLRPAHQNSGFEFDAAYRRASGAQETSAGIVVATIYYLKEGAEARLVDVFQRTIQPLLLEAGIRVLGYFVTESSPNTFPALPVREGVNVFVWFGGFGGELPYVEQTSTVISSLVWQDQVANELTATLIGDPEVLRLAPTARSRLRG